LTEEEKKQWFRKSAQPDMAPNLLATSFAKFSLPTKAEGFDEVTYEWQPESAVSKILTDYVFAQKMARRVEDLKPGEWFAAEWGKWQKQMAEWKKRQAEFKDTNKQKAYMAKKKEEMKKKLEEEGKGDEEPEIKELDVDDIDVFTVEDANDLGNGEPLFANFVYEDWVLINARFEFHLLIHSFKKDLNDADRPTFGENHMPFYYHKYYKKNFKPEMYSVKKSKDFIELIKDVASIDDKSFFHASKTEDEVHATFMKLAEENRRERTRREDAGDETAALKFPRPAATPPARPPQGVPQPYRAGAPQPGGKGYARPGPPQYAPQPGGAYGQVKRPMPGPAGYGQPPQQRPRQ